ncbi:MAG: TlpA family protein disulfide reductase [Planctomycetota bacterium]|jgi:hypothetical protein
MFARIAVDPARSTAERDSSAATALSYLVDSLPWRRLLTEAEDSLVERVTAEVRAGGFVPDSAFWMDSEGVFRPIRQSVEGQVTLVLYQRQPPDGMIGHAAETIRTLGGATVAFATMLTAADLNRSGDASVDSMPVFYDLRGDAWRAFELPGFPSYAVVDQSGRVRFSSLGSDLETAIRQVAVLITISQNAAVVD